MGYKPLASISFAEAQSLLSNLTLITMDNEQVFTINPKGFTFDSGEIELNDPPPEYALINAHMEDDPIHVDHTTLKDYALVCTSQPGAMGVSPAPLDLDLPEGCLDILLKIRVDTALDTSGDPVSRLLYRRKTSTDTIFALGVIDSQIGCQIGSNTYVCGDISLNSYPIFRLDAVGDVFDLGVSLDFDNMELHFLVNGLVTANQAFVTTGLPTHLEDTIEIGDVGFSVLSCALVYDLLKPLHNGFGADKMLLPPFPIKRPVHSLNYYNFRPVSGVTGVKDHALSSTYRANLTLATGATIEAVEIV